MVTMRLFFDTNIWLRYIIGDNNEHLNTVKNLIELNEAGRLQVSTSTFVLSEFIYVQQSFYSVTKSEIINNLNDIQSMRNLKIIDVTNFSAALTTYQTSLAKWLKWSDCVIATQVLPSYTLCSFDERLAKIIGADRFTLPDKALSKAIKQDE